MRNLSYSGLILAGIFHWPGRNASLVFCYLCIAAGIFSAQYLMTGTAGSVDLAVSRMGADLLAVPPASAQIFQGREMGQATIGTIIRVEPTAFRLNVSAMNTIGRVPGVSAMSPQLFVAILPEPGLSDTTFDIYGIDPVSDFSVQQWLAEPLNNPLGSGDIITGSSIAGIPGSSVSIGGNSYRIAGNLSPTGTAVDHTLFMTLDDAYALAATPGVLPASQPLVPRGSASAILIRKAPDADLSLVSSRIQQPFSYDTLRVIGKQITLRPVSQGVRALPLLLGIISLVIVIASLPLVAIITAMATHERQREIGMYASLGATRRFIVTLVLGESLMLAMAGGFSGSALAAVVLLNAGQFSPGSSLSGFPVPPLHAVALMAAEAVLVVILVALVAAALPAYRSYRMSPYDAIRSRE